MEMKIEDYKNLELVFSMARQQVAANRQELIEILRLEELVFTNLPKIEEAPVATEEPK